MKCEELRIVGLEPNGVAVGLGSYVALSLIEQVEFTLYESVRHGSFSCLHDVFVVTRQTDRRPL
jgi:hypothetical protein